MKLNKSILYIGLFCFLFVYAALPLQESIRVERGETALLMLIENIPELSSMMAEMFSFRIPL